MICLIRNYIIVFLIIMLLVGNVVPNDRLLIKKTIQVGSKKTRLNNGVGDRETLMIARSSKTEITIKSVVGENFCAVLSNACLNSSTGLLT